MTWQSILENKLLSQEGISRAAIYGVDGVCYASSQDLTISQAEIRTLERSLSSDPATLYAGITLGGEKYTYLACEPGSSVVCCLKKSGFVIVRTGKCIIVCEYNTDSQSAYCYSAAHQLAEQLQIHNY